MKIVHVKRMTKTETRYHKKMGELITHVVYIKRCVLGIPVRTLQKYRETYYGEVKDCEDCNLAA